MVWIIGEHINADGERTQQNILVIGLCQPVGDPGAAKLDRFRLQEDILFDAEILAGAIKHVTGRQGMGDIDALALDGLPDAFKDILEVTGHPDRLDRTFVGAAVKRQQYSDPRHEDDPAQPCFGGLSE